MWASRQTALLGHFPLKAECDGLGNSTPVAIEHYAQVTAEHFSAALNTLTAPNHAEQGEAIVKRNPQPRASADVGESSHETTKAPVFPGLFSTFAAVHATAGMGGEGLSEPDATVLPANELEQSPESGEAKSEAIRFDSPQLDADLLRVIDAWPTLLPAARQAVLSLVSREAEGNRDA